MENTNDIYRSLQQHLDKQAVGFPASKSGSDIRLLQKLFSAEQASLALHLNYQPQSAAEIFESVKSSGMSLENLESMLKEMVGNGAIGVVERNDSQCYFTMPLLVGIVEWHNSKATPQYAAALAEYMQDSGFARAFVSTKVSQMRTIPVEKSIQVDHHITTYDHLKEIINSSEGPIGVNRCMCRENASRRGQPCHKTSRSETCMVFGDWAKHFIEAGLTKKITREEALEIARQNEADGLVLQPTNYQKVDFVCACCGCCCGILRIQKSIPKPAAFWASNFYASVDTEKCSSCETCVERCQVNAVKIDEKTSYATINLDRCIGCGNCVVSCPSEALSLVKKEIEKVPPANLESLYKIMVENRAVAPG